MGCDELIESLRKEGEGKTRGIWKEAEAEAGNIRAAAALRLEALQRDIAAGPASKEGAGKVFLEAEAMARMIRLTSENGLSARLYSLAASSLGLLREERGKDIFDRLVHELPSAVWQRIKVNPEDASLAEKAFPNAEIVVAGHISGGMEAEADEGNVKVINTFEKRLERSWPQMLPDLMADIYKEVMNSDTTAKS